jgi:hypothetical protein
MLWNFAHGIDDRPFQPLHVRSAVPRACVDSTPTLATAALKNAQTDSQVDRDAVELGRTVHREGAGALPVRRARQWQG